MNELIIISANILYGFFLVFSFWITSYYKSILKSKIVKYTIDFILAIFWGAVYLAIYSNHYTTFRFYYLALATLGGVMAFVLFRKVFPKYLAVFDYLLKKIIKAVRKFVIFLFDMPLIRLMIKKVPKRQKKTKINKRHKTRLSKR